MTTTLYVEPEELRQFLQFDENDYPNPTDMKFLITTAMKRIDLDITTSSTNILFLATLYLAKAYVMRSLATRSVSKGYVQVNAEGRTITKAYQELVLEAENVEQEYKEFVMSQLRREATSTNFMTDTTEIDSLTRQEIIDIMTGKTNAEDLQKGYRFQSYSRSRQ